MATRAILGPASVYTSHVKIASDKAIKFSSTTDPDSGTYDLTLERASAATLKLTDGAGGVAKLNAVSGGTGQTAYAVGDILYASSTTALSRLAVGSNTNVLTLSGGLPTWAAPSGNVVDTLAATLAAGNTTSGTSIVVSAADGINGADSTAGTAWTIRGGNGSAGVGGVLTVAGGNGVGTNQTSGLTLSSGNSSGSGASTMLFKSVAVSGSGTTTNTAVNKVALAGDAWTNVSTVKIGWASSTDPTAVPDTTLERGQANRVKLSGLSSNNTGTVLQVQSTGTGTSCQAAILVARDNQLTDYMSFTQTSSSFTTSGVILPSNCYVLSQSTDPFNIGVLGNGVVRVFQNNAFCSAWGSAYMGHVSGLQMSWSSSSTDPTSTKDVGLARDAAGILRLTNGSTGYGTLAAPTIVPTAITGTNQAGTAQSISGGLGTGTGIPGLWKVQTGFPGASGSSAHTAVDRIYVGTKNVTITDNVAATYATVSCATGEMTGGMVVVTVRCSDGTDFQGVSLAGVFAVSNKAGTNTVSLAQVGAAGANTGASSQTTALSATAGTNAINLRINCDTTLVPTTFTVTYTIFINGTGTVTPS